MPSVEAHISSETEAKQDKDADECAKRLLKWALYQRSVKQLYEQLWKPPSSDTDTLVQKQTF